MAFPQWGRTAHSGELWQRKMELIDGNVRAYGSATLLRSMRGTQFVVVVDPPPGTRGISPADCIYSLEPTQSSLVATIPAGQETRARLDFDTYTAENPTLDTVDWIEGVKAVVRAYGV